MGEDYLADSPPLFKFMKKTRVFVLVNVLNNVSSYVYDNHIGFFLHTARTLPDIEFRFWTPPRMSIDNARNQAALYAMNTDCDYLMFIDDDVLIPENTLVELLKADKDIIAGLVMIRGFPFNVMAFKWEKDDQGNPKNLGYFNDLPKERGIVECDAVGFSCCLIKMDIIKALEPPYFVTGKSNTEDVYFCLKVKDILDPQPGIFMHTGVECGHLLNPLPIVYSGKQKFYDFYAPVYEKEPEFKRDQAYIDACVAGVTK